MAFKDAKRCGAKTRGGGRCKSPAMENGRCRMHGGASPKGIASATFKTGERSADIPARLIDRYQAAMSDNDLLNLRRDIALTDVRVGELLSRLDAGDPGKDWLELKKLNGAFKASVQSGNMTDAVKAVRDMDAIIERGAGDHAIWEQIGTALDNRRKLVDTERKRLVAMQQMISSEQAMTLITALVQIIKENVSDRDVLTRIQSAVTRLLDPRNRPAADAE